MKRTVTPNSGEDSSIAVCINIILCASRARPLADAHTPWIKVDHVIVERTPHEANRGYLVYDERKPLAEFEASLPF